VSIVNRGNATWDRLLNVRLGVYRTDVAADDHDPDYPVYLTQEHLGGPVIAFEDPVGRKRGFPAYLEQQYFLSLAHPAGFALRQEKTVTLKQLPGAKLEAGKQFDCMEAVYGVAAEGQARPPLSSNCTIGCGACGEGTTGRWRSSNPSGPSPTATFGAPKNSSSMTLQNWTRRSMKAA